MRTSLRSSAAEPQWRTVARLIVIGGIVALVALVFQIFVAPRLAAQTPDRSFGYVMLVGTDTVGVERVTVRDRVWSGDIISRGLGRLVWQAAEIAPARFTALDLSAYRTNSDETPFQRVSLGMDGDSAVLTMIQPAGGARRVPSRRGALILVNSSMAQLALFAAGRAPGARDSVPVFLASGAQTVMAYVRRDGDTTRFTIGSTETQFYHDSKGDIIGGAIPAQGLRVLRVEGNALASVTLGAPTYDAPAGAPYRAEQVRIRAGDHELAATFTRPTEGAGPFPVVVTISGSGAQDRDEYLPVAGGFRPFRQLADTLARRGVAVLRFDDRGYGSSTGNFATATSIDFADDVRDVVRYLRGRPDVASEQIFLLGHSEGGIIAPMVAATDARIKGVVLMAGTAETGREVIHFQQRYAVEHDTTPRSAAARDSLLVEARAQLEQTLASNPWMKFFVDYDPLPAARQMKQPALILQGETDQQVTAAQAQRLATAMRDAGNRDVTVRVFPNLNHLFLVDPVGNPAHYARLPNNRMGPEVTGFIVDWILQRAR